MLQRLLFLGVIFVLLVAAAFSFPTNQIRSSQLAGSVASSLPTGTIVCYAVAAAPSGWVACDGASYDGTTSTYSALWGVIQNTYGGSGQSSFKVPDMRGRVAVCYGQGTGLTSRAINDKGGEERHTLSVGEIPAHSHSIGAVGSYGLGYGIMDGQNCISTGTLVTQSTGGGGAHNTMPPWLGVQYIIRL